MTDVLRKIICGECGLAFEEEHRESHPLNGSCPRCNLSLLPDASAEKPSEVTR